MKRERQGGPVLATAFSGQQRGVLASCGGDESKELRVWDAKLAPRGSEPVTSAVAESTVRGAPPNDAGFRHGER